MSAIVMMMAGTAMAAPIQLAHSGRLLDADGEPVSGTVQLAVQVYQTGNPAVEHTTTFDSYQVADGFYSVFLDVDTDTFLLPTSVVVRVNGIEVGGPTPLVRVPNAAVADVASRVAVTVDSPIGDCGEEGAVTWSRADASLYVCDNTGAWTAVGGGGDVGAVEPGNFNVASTGETLFTVPAGVTSLDVRAWGGGGAGGNQAGATGGGGAYIEASISVIPGEELQIRVAEGGDVQGSAGGASLVLRDGTPLVVAGGGGGGASDGNGGNSYSGGRGGAGGGLVGEAGTAVNASGSYCALAGGGGGGTQNAGGAGGNFSRGNGTNSNDCGGASGNGSFLTGGRCSGGGAASGFSNGGSAGNGAGPSGGAGYYGGGGGGSVSTYCAGGGGGGSSYAEPSATNVVMQGGSASTPGESTTGAGGARLVGYSFVAANRGGDGRIELAWGD